MGPLSGRGSTERFAVWSKRIWIFASDGCRSGFLTAPERYVDETKPFPETSREEAETARQWLRRAVKAHGGQEALRRMQALELGDANTVQGWRNELSLLVDAKGRVRRTLTGRWA